MEYKILYIIRNNDRHPFLKDKRNTSILGVFDDPRLARKAILRKRTLQNDLPHMELKCVPLNGTDYFGCSAYSVEELINDPDKLERDVKEWFKHHEVLITQ